MRRRIAGWAAVLGVVVTFVPAPSGAQVTLDEAKAELRVALDLLGAEKLTEAMPHFHRVVEGGGKVDPVALIVYRDASSKGVRVENWPYAIRGIEAAKTFPVSPKLGIEFDFWLGWSLYQYAAQLEVDRTPQSAALTKPMFERAKVLLEAGRPYAEEAHFAMSGIMLRVDTYIQMESDLLTP